MGEVVPVSDVPGLMERDRLFGRGIGWVDAHLIAASMNRGFALWTSDPQLDRIAAVVGRVLGTVRQIRESISQ